MAEFQLHADFGPTSHGLGELKLCSVRLHADARWPWLILVPRRPEVSEIDQLSAPDRAQLMDEQVLAMGAVRALGEALLRPVSKLNIAALGNVTPQLHIHIIGRRSDDPAWPSPVWGVGSPRPYSDTALMVALSATRQALGI